MQEIHAKWQATRMASFAESEALRRAIWIGRVVGGTEVLDASLGLPERCRLVAEAVRRVFCEE